MGKMDSKKNKDRITLDSLPKVNIHKVPDRYFDELPGIIQSRVAEPPSTAESYSTLGMGWRLAMAFAAFALIAVFAVLFQNGSYESSSASDLLADVPVEALIDYLETTDITAEEIIAELNMEDFTAESILEDEAFQLLDDDEILELDDTRLFEEFGLDQEDVF